MSPISLDTTVTLSPNAVFRDMDGEGVILDLQSGTYFGLNEVGTRMWQLIEKHGRLSAVLGALEGEYDVAADVLERDLLELTTRLIEKGLGEAT